MNEVPITGDEQQQVSKMYDEYQRINQEAHDEARRQISAEYDVSEEEAERMPQMEERFEVLRRSATATVSANGGQNPAPQIMSVNPGTGEPGTAVPRQVARPEPSIYNPQPAAAAPQATMWPASSGPSRVQIAEQALIAQGFTVVQSASDYESGVVSIVIK
tara:strand:+ start:4881 stop:5363 length:483 start_codon:yes stop_codon:yes gene_type:complete